MTFQELKEKTLKDLQQKEAKDAIAHPGKTKQLSSDDFELNKRFWLALKSGNPDQATQVNELIKKDYKEKGQTVGTIGTGTTGGLLVPTTVSNNIVTKMQYISPMDQIATVINDMPANFQLPSENAIVQAYWVGEGVAPTASNEVFDPNLLTPGKAAGLDTFSREVIADAATNPSIANFVEQRFAVAIALLKNAAFVGGDGSNKPYGFRSSAITPGSVAQQGDTLQYTDVTTLWAALKAAYRSQAVFVVSTVGLTALMNVRDNQGRPIFRQSLVEGNPSTVLGRPVYLVDEIPQNLGTGAQSEIWFGLFSNYIIGYRGGLVSDWGTNGTDFANDQISLRVIQRVAGRPMIGESFVKLTGVQ